MPLDSRDHETTRSPVEAHEKPHPVEDSAVTLHQPPALPVPVGEERPPLTGRRLRLAPLLWVLLPVGAIALAWWAWFSSNTPLPQYRTAVVDHGPVTATVTATGTVNPVISVLVGSQVSGKIKALYADFNSVVKEGQAIAQIDPAVFKARVDQATASLRNAKGALIKAHAALAQRKIEMTRMETLRRQQFVAQADLDLARTSFRDAAAQVEVVQAQVDQAEAALANAKLDLGYTTIYSPVNGIVVSRNVDVGQTVVATMQTPTLFVIAQDLTRMQVNANVSESDIGGVAELKTAEFTVDAFPKEPFTGTVVQVRNAPISIQNVVTYDVVIQVDNLALKLKPGMTANVAIITAHEDRTLRVPNAALRFRPPGVPIDKTKTAVWTLDAQGQPQAVTITPGIADQQFTQVREGTVREGDAVIVGMEAAEGQEQKTLPPGFGFGPRMR